MATTYEGLIAELRGRGWSDQMLGWLSGLTGDAFSTRLTQIDQWLTGNFNPAQLQAIKSQPSFESAQSFIQSQLPPGASPFPPVGPGTPGTETNPPREVDPPGPTGPPAGGDANASARALINQTLAQYGLGSLGDWAWQKYLAGTPISQIMLELRQTPEYKARFPAMEALGKQGRAISESQYIEYERNAASLFRSYGLPAGFYDDPTDFTNFLTRGVALPELKSRLDDYQTLAYNSPREVQDAFLGFYGTTPGQYLAYFIDPDKALPLIEKQVNAAQAAGASTRTGYAALTREQAEGLASLGLDPSAYQPGFNQLAAQREILQGLPGHNWTPVSTDTALAAQFGGNADAQQLIEDRALDLVAPNKAGGQVASTQRGAVGAGVAR